MDRTALAACESQMCMNGTSSRRHTMLMYPAWAAAIVQPGRRLSSVSEAMAIVLDLMRGNIRAGGGPFASLVISSKVEVTALGYNLVTQEIDPTAHAEIVGIRDACRRIGSHCLPGSWSLVTTCEPCRMCSAAIHLSNLGHVYYAASDEDTLVVGFAPNRLRDFDAEAYLRSRRIGTTGGLLRREAVELLHLYAELGGTVYTPDKGGPGGGEHV